MFVSQNVLGSLVVDLSGDRLDAVFLRETGATGDSFSIVKSRIRRARPPDRGGMPAPLRPVDR